MNAFEEYCKKNVNRAVDKAVVQGDNHFPATSLISAILHHMRGDYTEKGIDEKREVNTAIVRKLCEYGILAEVYRLSGNFGGDLVVSRDQVRIVARPDGHTDALRLPLTGEYTEYDNDRTIAEDLSAAS